MRRAWVIGWLAAVMAMIPLFMGKPGQISGQAAPQKQETPVEDAVPQLMEAVGLLAGLQLYQTYLNIGFLADGKTEGIYEEKDVRQLLASIMTPLDLVDKQMAKVDKLAQSKEDREALDKLRKIMVLLRNQGKELETFWTTGKEKDGAKYGATRKQAWESISTLLGLDKQ